MLRSLLGLILALWLGAASAQTPAASPPAAAASSPQSAPIAATSPASAALTDESLGRLLVLARAGRAIAAFLLDHLAPAWVMTCFVALAAGLVLFAIVLVQRGERIGVASDWGGFGGGLGGWSISGPLALMLFALVFALLAAALAFSLLTSGNSHPSAAPPAASPAGKQSAP